MKKQQPRQKTQRPPAKDRPENHETYLAPPPPSKGRIIGLDCHPDTFTAAVFRGSTPHDAVKLSSHPDMSLKRLLEWAAKEFTRGDLFLMEAGSNSFEIHRRLLALGLRAVVMESCHVGKQAKTYADNDKMAAARIALVYLQGNAPCVWIPDAATCERRELLHAYTKAVADHTAAGNALKGYLNQYTPCASAPASSPKPPKPKPGCSSSATGHRSSANCWPTISPTCGSNPPAANPCCGSSAGRSAPSPSCCAA